MKQVCKFQYTGGQFRHWYWGTNSVLDPYSEKELQQTAERRGLATGGTQDELVGRLVNDDVHRFLAVDTDGAKSKSSVQIKSEQLSQAEKEQQDQPEPKEDDVNKIPCEPNTTRSSSAVLDDDRRKLLENKDWLFKAKRGINIEGTLMDHLLEKNVLSPEEKELIMEEDTSERVGTLINFLLKKSNGHFDKFCEALMETDHAAFVISALTVPEVDAKSAGQKLANHYLEEYTHIDLYTRHRQRESVKLPELYTASKLKLLESKKGKIEEKDLQDYHEMLRLMMKSKVTRLVIDGQPGIGKSTLFKKIAYDWASRFNPKTGAKYLKTELHEYSHVLFVTLRYVAEGYDFVDMIWQAYPFLSVVEVFSCIEVLEKMPGKVLLLVDGADEYRQGEKEIIYKTLLKLRYPDVLCCTTTRPERVKYLKQHKAAAVEKHASIRGFTKAEIRKYINKWYTDDPELAKSLFEHISIKKPQFLEIAQVPIRLEMMCLLWLENKDFGDTESDLYEMFAKYNLTHLEKKHIQDPDSLTPEREIIQKFHPLLLLARLAYSFTISGEIDLVFDDEQVHSVLGKDMQPALDLGFLTCSHPKSAMRPGFWSFSHATIQEYFIAYYLLHSADEEETIRWFVHACATSAGITRNKVILNFLCGMAPEVSNRILQEVVYQYLGNNNEALLSLAENLASKYKDPSTVCIPSPREMVLDKPPTRNMLLFLKSDMKLGATSNKSLTIKSIKYVKEVKECGVTRLHLMLDDEENMSIAETSFKPLSRIKGLQEVILQVPVMCGIQLKRILDMLGHETLKRLVVIGKNATEATACFLQTCKTIQHLDVSDREKQVPTDILVKLFKQVKEHEQLETVYYNMLSFDKGIIHEMLSTKQLGIHFDTMSTSSLHELASEALKQGKEKSNVSMKGLVISSCDITMRPSSVNLMLFNLPTLKFLGFQKCVVRGETFDNVVQIFSHVGTPQESLKIVDMSGTNLCKAGLGFGGLIAYMPNLEALLLQQCSLIATDLEDITTGIMAEQRAIPAIKQLDLSRNNLHQGMEKVSSFLSLFKEIHILHLREVNAEGDEFINTLQKPEIVAEMLSVLDLSNNKCLETSLLDFSEGLKKFRNLSNVKMRNCSCNKDEEVEDFLTHLPQQVKSLDLSQNSFSHVALLQSQEALGRMSQLTNMTIQHLGLETEQLRCTLYHMNPTLTVRVDELPLQEEGPPPCGFQRWEEIELKGSVDHSLI